jgi:hypothetical protein
LKISKSIKNFCEIPHVKEGIPTMIEKKQSDSAVTIDNYLLTIDNFLKTATKILKLTATAGKIQNKLKKMDSEIFAGCDFTIIDNNRKRQATAGEYKKLDKKDQVKYNSLLMEKLDFMGASNYEYEATTNHLVTPLDKTIKNIDYLYKTLIDSMSIYTGYSYSDLKNTGCDMLTIKETIYNFIDKRIIHNS